MGRVFADVRPTLPAYRLLGAFQIVLLSKNYDVAWKIGVWGNFHPRASSLAYKRHAVADVHLVGFCIICSRSSSFHASLSIRENYQRKPDEILRGQNMLWLAEIISNNGRNTRVASALVCARNLAKKTFSFLVFFFNWFSMIFKFGLLILLDSIWIRLNYVCYVG